MKHNYTSKTSKKNCALLLALFLLAIVQGAWGQETVQKVSMTISTVSDVFVNAQRFDNPSIILRSDGKQARAYYKLSYSFNSDDTDSKNDIKDGDGYTIQTHTATGTQLNTHNGRIVKVGNKAGNVVVNVTATVTKAYEGKYQETVSESYNFNIKSPDTYTISATYNGDPLTSSSVIKLTRGKDKYNNVKNIGEAKLSKPIVSYVSDNGMTIDVTDYFDVTLTCGDKLKATQNSDGSYSIVAGDNVTESVTGQGITFSAKVKDGYRDTYGYDDNKTDGKSATPLTAKADIKYLTSSDKIQTYLVFEKQELTKYKLSWKSQDSGGDASFKSPVYKIVDADGNDYTDAYSFDGGEAISQNAFYKYSQDPLDFGKDLKNSDNKPFESLSSYPNLRVEHTDGCTVGWPTNHQANGQAWIPDDYIITVNFKLPEYSDWYGILSTTPATIKEGDSKATVAGMFYSINQDNKYEVDKGHFVLHVLKRAPEISMVPDPETTPIAKNYVMTSFNRFDLYGKFNDDKSDFKVGENWSLHLGGPNNDNDFWYTYFVPDDVAWPSDLSETDSTSLETSLAANDGQVLVQVMGALTNEGRYIKNLKMSVPVYETETVTINEKTYTKYKTGTDGKPIPVMISDGNGGKIQQMTTKTGTMYISQREFGNDPGSWKVEFHGKGYVPISYVVIPWNATGWDVGSVSSHMFHIVESEPVKFILDPKNFTVPVGSTAPAPSAKVVDNFGKDLTKYYNFAWAKTNDTDNQITSLNDDHSSTGKKQGAATVKVTPTQNEDATQVENWRVSDGWNPNVYEKTTNPANDSYTVNVVGDADKLAQYDIIYDSLGYYNGAKDENGLTEPEITKRESSKMGKLHFIKNGEFYPGTTSLNEAPGINITFGTGNDTDPWTVATGTKTGTTTPDGSFDSETGQPCILKAGNVDFDGYDEPTESHTTPTGGGFLKLEPYTNGFLTIDAHFGDGSENIRYRLLDVTDKNFIQEVGRPSDLGTDVAYGEASFTYALMEGHTYYLWCYQNDFGFYIHGLLFKPGYVVMRQDTETATEASMFENGFAGDLPKLVNTDRSPAVTFTKTFTDWTKTATINGTSKNADDIIDIEDNYRFVAKGNTMGNRVRVRANVKGKVKEENGSKVTVARAPYIDISVVALPMYKPTPDDVIYPGKRVTTTNFVTRMWMTWGGWENDSEQYPYYRRNTMDPTKANNNALYDTYIQAKSDTVGANNRTIDGFKYGSGLQGNSNPTDENVQSWNTSRNPNTFNLPVRGGYVKFEPEESGTLMAYVIQNGMTDLTDDRPTNKIGEKDKPTELRRRAMYIVDETGKPVDIASGNTGWDGISQYFASGDNQQTTDKNYVTEGLLRCSWNSDSPISVIKDHGFNFNQWASYYTKGTEDEKYKADVKAITDYWHVAKGAANDPYNKLMKVFRLSDGSFVLPTKAYVRYTFKVKAGKTYYMFQTGSKMNFAGFAFVPTGFTKDNKYWKECQVPSDDEEYNPYNETDAKVRAELPEPTNSIYSQSSDTPGFADIPLNESGSNTVDSKKLGDAKAEFVNVTLTRPFTPNKWTSICLPFSLSEYQVKHIFGTNAQVITFDSVMTAHKELVSPVSSYRDNPKYEEVKERTVHFTQHVNQLMEAGRPYFIKPTFKVVDEDTETESVPTSVDFNDDKSKVTAITFKHVSLEGVSKMDVSCSNDSARKNVEWTKGRLDKKTELGLSEDSITYYTNLQKGKSIFEYRFSGTYDRQQIPWYSYVMGEQGEKNGLFRVVPSSGNDAADKPYLKGFRAYLYPYRDSNGNDIPDPLTVTEHSKEANISDLWITGAMVYGDNGKTTGIDEIVSDMNAQLTYGIKGVFNLSGQMVRNINNLKGLPAGMYIMNGQKYVVK